LGVLEKNTILSSEFPPHEVKKAENSSKNPEKSGKRNRKSGKKAEIYIFTRFYAF
jgi:hypothetical protein